ncbi:hypothetical protein DM02DRAFT_699298 [Periconia macrospinosa]|uniref:Fumarylacetoacetase-like C-terminal domain-containing protein n=1 Tax=Periconia macrospinosa TaxID=97972 RepID=A0A2V1DY78_9PLEO|nr:hypothetical protein DM02DRAFT_699298 [Periconia macrospinosa]
MAEASLNIQPTWKRLIRFRGEDGLEVYGEPQIDKAEELLIRLEDKTLLAEVYRGNSIFEVERTGKIAKVTELLHLLESKDVPTIRCIGLNYRAHIAEAGRKPPPYPSLFIKHNNSVAGWDEDIPVPKVAQNEQCDYEGELSIVIGQSGKNIPKEDAISYVAGYVTSNDVSSRKWQRELEFAGNVPQWCFSKGFDKYAPLGPMITSPLVVGSANNLWLKTWVNGEERQSTNTSDLLFDVPTIISFLSQGTTLERGTVIMTGTPSGVGLPKVGEQRWLRDGDIVEVAIEHCGQTRNKFVYI